MECILIEDGYCHPIRIRSVAKKFSGEGVTTEDVLRNVMVDVSWGTINPETREWVLAQTEASASQPAHDASLVTYREYESLFFSVE